MAVQPAKLVTILFYRVDKDLESRVIVQGGPERVYEADLSRRL